jgi:CPA2 family monovalent cation:H+ antiporter-2
MATALAFLQDLAVVTLVAALSTLLFHRIRLPVVLGYLLAGIIVGPYTPPFPLVSESEIIAILGEIGVIILLFAVGLEFNLRKLREVGVSAVVAALIGTSLIIAIGFGVGRAFGLGGLEAAFLGAIMSVSSTTIIVKVLAERGEKDKAWARFILGVTLVEDVIAVVVLTLLSGAAAGGGDFSLASVGAIVLRLALFLGAALVLGTLLVPRIVGYVASLRIDEMLVLVAVGLAFGLSLLASTLGFSTALGAFVMGALVAESAAVRQVEMKVSPIRDLFTAIFFVTVGMLLDPSALVTHWPLILGVTAAVVFGRMAALSFATFVTGHDPRFALRVGFGLVPLGEFSFIIAALAVASGLTDVPLYAVAVAGSVLTAFAAPFLMGRAPAAADAFERHAPRPVLTYARVYARWIERMGHLQRNDPARVRLQHATARAGLYAAVVVALLAGGAASLARIMDALEASLPIRGEAVLIAGWASIALVVSPFVVLLVKALVGFVHAFTEAAMPQRLASSDVARYVRPVVQRTFLLTALVVAGALVVAVAAPLLPTGRLLVAIVVLVALVISASVLLLYNSLTTFQRRVDETVSGVLSGEDPRRKAEEREGILAIVRDQYPWGVSAREVEVPATSTSVNRTIRDLNLRSRTGATLVGIHRGDDVLLNPDPSTRVLPQDRVVVVGEEEQVAAASDLLLAEPAEPESGRVDATRWREARVRDTSPLVARTLAESRLRERTGATVVGIVRAGERLMSPPPTFRLQPGDVLLLMGTEEAVAQAIGEAAWRPT